MCHFTWQSDRQLVAFHAAKAQRSTSAIAQRSTSAIGIRCRTAATFTSCFHVEAMRQSDIVKATVKVILFSAMDRRTLLCMLLLMFAIRFSTLQQQLLLLICNHRMFVNNMLMQLSTLEESVREDCQPRKKKPRMWMRPRSCSWFDTILKNAPDSLWIEHLRLPRQEEEQLAEMLKEELAPSDFCVRNPVPLLECVCIALFKLAVVNIVLQQSILEFQMQLCCVVSLHSVQR